jgi:hypothetical protein
VPPRKQKTRAGYTYFVTAGANSVTLSTPWGGVNLDAKIATSKKKSKSKNILGCTVLYSDQLKTGHPNNGTIGFLEK